MHGEPRFPHYPILLVNSPSPSEILLKHLLLSAAFPTPTQLGACPFQLACETVTLFTEPLGAKLGGLCIHSQGPSLPLNKALFQTLDFCQDSHSSVGEMWTNTIYSGNCPGTNDRPSSLGGLGLVV